MHSLFIITGNPEWFNQQAEALGNNGAVSYTHLTLPTIYSV